MQNLNWRLIAEIVGGVLFVALVVWFFFFRSTSGLTPADTAQQQTFGTGDTRTTAGAPTADDANLAQSIQSPVPQTKVFKITDGPVAGAAFSQEDHPTTTVARFVMQQNGHVLDLPIDSPGSVAHSVSNTTIPGAQQAVWETQSSGGRQVAAGTILQYLDNTTIKSVVLSFPQESEASTSSLPAPVRIHFLPDGAYAVAVSPDGRSVAYLLAVSGGADLYTAGADSLSPKKLATLPLSQLDLSWPAAGTLLATSRAAAGVPGIAFSISAASGAVSPSLYALGLTTTADAGFNYVIYQSASAAGHTTYVHTVKTNLDRPLSFDPIPEKCVWSRLKASTLYCAVPLSYTAPNYLDLWHAGTASAADSILSYDLLSGKTTIVATPGGDQGGVASDITQLALSADEKYLLFVKKGDRSVWGVRL
jgi:hypothetical protein